MNSDLTYCKKYFSDVGQRVYENHRKNSRKPFKISQVEDFMNFAEEKILINGHRIRSAEFFTICLTKWFAPKRFTIELQLTKIKNIDLKQKLRRKPKKIIRASI